ncbi:hypothetical protein [Achromobacter spanius]|uniref:hypothetical protein n=1 Tax=Achromobacter spanius TaxID=217203 RepID=UPI001F547A9A|nr:hypothetical protein [Achromobacter spanius]
MLETDKKKRASARRPVFLRQPSPGAPMQFLLAQDAGQLVARQAATQHAIAAHEKPTYRCQCARERQAQCEQVTLTHGAPYLDTLGVAVQERTQGL